MIYLLGISHNYQWDKNSIEQIVFINYLKTTIQKLNIQIIAEEWSLNTFKEKAYKCIHSTSVFDIAKEFKVNHAYIDTDREIDKKLGIKRDDDIKKELGIRRCEKCMKNEDREMLNKLRMPNHRKREQYWLTQINEDLKKEMIFVCGYHHILPFRELLNKQGINSKILPKTFITNPPNCYLCDK